MHGFAASNPSVAEDHHDECSRAEHPSPPKCFSQFNNDSVLTILQPPSKTTHSSVYAKESVLRQHCQISNESSITLMASNGQRPSTPVQGLHHSPNDQVGQPSSFLNLLPALSTVLGGPTSSSFHHDGIATSYERTRLEPPEQEARRGKLVIHRLPSSVTKLILSSLPHRDQWAFYLALSDVWCFKVALKIANAIQSQQEEPEPNRRPPRLSIMSSDKLRKGFSTEVFGNFPDEAIDYRYDIDVDEQISDEEDIDEEIIDEDVIDEAELIIALSHRKDTKRTRNQDSEKLLEKASRLKL